MAKDVDGYLCSQFEQNGYVRVGDNEAGARFVRGSDTVYVSGHMVFVRFGGHMRAFPEDKAKMLGIRMMERECAMRPRPRPFDGKEDTTNYDIWKAGFPV